MSGKTSRGVLFVVSVLYYGATAIPAVAEQAALHPYFRTFVGLYLVLGVTLSQAVSRLFPKPVQLVAAPLLYVPNRLAIASSPVDLVQIFSIIFAAKITVRCLYILFNIDLFILFKSTVLTTEIISGLSRLTPFLLLLALPAIRYGGWYYLVTYCALCGGTVLLSGIGVMMTLGVVWRNIVVSDWTRLNLLS